MPVTHAGIDVKRGCLEAWGEKAGQMNLPLILISALHLGRGFLHQTPNSDGILVSLARYFFMGCRFVFTPLYGPAGGGIRIAGYC